MKSLRSRLAMLLLASTMLAPLDALAQSVQSASDEIVVTARKREEAVKDVPLSVSVYSPQAIEEVSAGGADIGFLSARTPSVNVESSFGRTFPRFYIRGLGNTDFDLNASQPVSLVFDDVVQENPVLKGFPAFDLQRIEVLRGPQGTLFGRNTPAGVIKFDSVAAGAGVPAYAKMELRNLGGIAGEGAVGFDLAPGLSLRVAGLINTQDDWVDNLGTADVRQLGGYTDQAIRAQLRYQPGSDLDMSLTVSARDFDGTGQLFRANAIRPTGGLVGGFNRERVFYDGGAGNPQVLRTLGAVGKVEWDLGDMTLTSVTGYQTIDNFFSGGDIDGGLLVGPPAGAITPFPSETSDEVTDHSQFSQEFRLASNSGGAFDWLIGAYFFDEEVSILSLSYNTPAASVINGRATQTQETEAWAIFGSASFKPTDALTLTAGLRYSDEEKDFRGARTLSPFAAPNITRAVKVGDEAVSWDLSAVYALDADQNLYARVARGFRAPAIQGRILFSDAVTTAKSEFVTSYEAGYKASLWDGRLRADASIFYYEIDDQQFTAIGGAGNFNQLLNANKGVGQGAEVDVVYTPSDNWAFRLGVAYNDTEIQDRNREVAICTSVPSCNVTDPTRVVPGVPFPVTLANINGNSFPNAPEWTANVAARWQTDLADGAKIFISTDWAYKGETNFFLYESRAFREEGFWEGGLRAGWTTPDERFSIVLFGRNITDEERLVGGVDFNNLTGFLNQPRIYGAELKVTY